MSRLAITVAVLAIWALPARAAEIPGAAKFRKDVQPILKEFCYDCHGDGEKKGGIAFDEFKTDQALLENRDLWWNALKYLRAGIMPPEKKPRPSEEEKKRIATWIKAEVFGIDPKNPDPGRVTVRRLNRVEYRNTIRDLMGVDFNTEMEFPPDDTGHGFDNIADVLTLSPMLLEKYLAAAKHIVKEAVPTAPKVPAEITIPGSRFRRVAASNDIDKASATIPEGLLSLTYYEPATVTNKLEVKHPGTYRLILELMVKGNNGERGFDSNKCEVVFKADDRELLRKQYGWHERKELRFEFDQNWMAGEHGLGFELQPLTPDVRKSSALEMRLVSATVRGPLEENFWVRPKNYDHFFASDVGRSPEDRRKQVHEALQRFAQKAFRRPVDQPTIARLVALAESFYNRAGKTFEAGLAHAMVAVLASPQFLFREEAIQTTGPNQSYPLVSEYSLASRLSYFLWSSMPDDELFRLAERGELRKNLAAQVKRMLADSRSESLIQNFSGQWLQVRDIEMVQIDARSVLARDDGTGNRGRGGFSFRPPRAELDGELRKAMRRETEMYFSHIVHDGRPVVELIDSDYTFLNEKLAKHYGLTNLNVTGSELRRVTLPPDSQRGGILTHGSVLAVTSNPTRTSPVKRGLFILDNILGTPPPPPPPDIPPLEDAAKEVKDRTPTLRETLELHRGKPLCSSCHNRMDPLGLAFENFNAMGMWREKELNQPVEVAGKLITGESFTNIVELKRILVSQHRLDFYRTLTEKLLTYALGRGLEYYDVETVDRIVERLNTANGQFSALLMGVVESAPFQKSRNPTAVASVSPAIEPGVSTAGRAGSSRTAP